MKFSAEKIYSAMKSCKRNYNMRRRIASAALCFVLLCTNAAGVLADEIFIENPSPEEITVESSGQDITDAISDTTEQLETVETKICEHHTEHNEECGYTDENPVCIFVCAVCLVQQQIDDFLAQLEQVDSEELDEEGTMQIYDTALAAKRAFEHLEWDEQSQIENFDTIEMILETMCIQTLEDSEATMDIATAVIRAEGETEQSLTDNGTFTVDFSKQFTLHIVVKSTLNLQNKKMEITVPDGLTVVEYPIPERGGMVESVTPESIDELNSENNYGGYCPTNGTITYSLKAVSEESSFNIILEPDTTLWNRRKEQTLAKALTVKVYTDGTDGKDYETVSSNAKIKGNYDATSAIQTGPRLSGIGVKTGVPTAADTPFALRQIWLNPDKDYIDMPQFFSKLEITIALPYYGSGSDKVYAQLDHITYDPAGMSTKPNMLNPENHPKDEKGEYMYGFGFEQKLDETNQTVTLTWENLYVEYGQEYLTPYFKWENACDNTTTNAVKWSSDLIHYNLTQTANDYKGDLPTSTGGAVSGKITWASISNDDNSIWYPWNNHFKPLTFTAYDSEKMLVTVPNRPHIYNAYESDKNIIYYLGQFNVVNHGGVESAPKTVEFKYTATDNIGVTAQRIPANNGNTVEVWYTTNKNTEKKYETETLTSSGGFVTFTAEMAGLTEGEYFTSIKANVGSYDRDYVGYVSSRSNDPTSGYCATFGKLLSNDAATYTDFASMKMYDTDANDTNVITATYKVTVTSTVGEIPLAMEQAYTEDLNKLGYWDELKPKENTDTTKSNEPNNDGITVNDTYLSNRTPILSAAYDDEHPDAEGWQSKTKATAGDTIIFNGLLSSSAYPYSNNNIATDVEIYIRLPEKVMVDEDSIRLYRRIGSNADKVFLLDAVKESASTIKIEPIDSTAYKFEKVSTAATTAEDSSDTTATSYELYKITFTDTTNPEKIGWFTDELGQYQIGLLFAMEIAKDADAMTLDMRDCVRMKSKALNGTTNNGTLSQYQVKDTYDMDDDNNITELFSTFNVNAEGTKLSVVASRLGLTFTFGAKVASLSETPDYKPIDYYNYEVDGKKVFLKDNDNAVDMLFTLKNETGRAFSEAEAKAFYYFIPVPKAGDFWDSHMQDKEFDFNMKLAKEPEIVGISKDNILVTYATDIESKANAGEAKHYATTSNYVTKEKLLENCTTDEEKAAAWTSVKMIRIAVKDTATGIRENAEMEVYMHLVPEFNNNADLVGSVINFGPCGVSPYSVGNTTNQGHNPLPRIQVEFQTGVINGIIFLDKNFNGTYDKGTDTLYTDTVNVKAPHYNGVGIDDNEEHETNEAHETNTKDGTFKFTGRRADTYHVIITNPGSTDANSTNPLKFSLSSSDGPFYEDKEKNSATATVTLEKGKGTANLSIGLQQPHTVTFEAENATLSKYSPNVWHGDKLGEVIPTVTPADGYRFDGNWTDGTKTYTTAELKTQTINADTTFTAVVNKLYSVSYDLNGGSGADAPTTTNHIAGEKVLPDYTGTDKLTKGEKTIFAGWSLEQISDILPVDAAQDVINKIITADVHYMPANDVILYAVYAVDANGNGNPDYNDNAVHVRYHGNNNDRTDVICPHHHVVGALEKLSTSGTVYGKILDHDADASAANGEVTAHTFTYGTNIFIGWSTTPILDTVIKTNEEFTKLKDSIKNEVTMLPKANNDVPDETAKDTSKYADADGNTNVYAVWAADRNGNGIADYLEEYTLTYYGNDLQGGTVDKVPTDTNIYLPGDKVTLSTTAPTHTNLDDKKVVFIGWTAKPTSTIYKRADTAPTTINEVAFGKDNITVYAAWGYDEDNDETADVLETYSLTYNLNGGTGTAPEGKDSVNKNEHVTLTTEKNFTRNANELFVGWSREICENAFTAEQIDDVNKVLITGTEIIMGTKDVTLYAVWAVDANNNGAPDYNDTAVHVRYHDNTEECRDIVCPDHHLAGAKVQLYSIENAIKGGISGRLVNHGETPDITASVGTYTFVNGTNILIGWTTNEFPAVIHTKNEYDNLKDSICTAVTMTDAGADVYAVWGTDLNGNGTADCLEKHSLTYAGNAQQEGTVENTPTDKNSYVYGDNVTLSNDTMPTHNSIEGKTVLFIGWTAQPTSTIYIRTDNLPDLITEVKFEDDDITVYAAWGYDEDDNGTADVLETFSLTYDLNGGSPVHGMTYETARIRYGADVAVKPAPIRNGYTFIGWSDGTSIYQPGDILTMLGNITLTAQWDKNNGFGDFGGFGDGGLIGGRTAYYTLYYNSNGGTEYKNERYAKNTVVQLDKIPVREGCTFTGWFADEELTEPVTEIKMTGNKTVYAGWESTCIPDWLNGMEHSAYVTGYVDGTVRPLNNISRAEVATIFFRLLKDDIREENLATSNIFTDVNENMWCNTAISTVAKLGIVKGRASNRFDPDAPITRAEFAVICARFDTSKRDGNSDFTDISGHWAEAEIERVAALGWIMGYTDGTFRPENYITRAEAMTMINRVLNRLPEDEDDLLYGMNTWSDNQPGTWYYLAVQEATNSHYFNRKGDVHEQWTELTDKPDWTKYQ